MRKDFGSQSWLFPMPVLIVGSYDENGIPDAMNAAWGGIHDTNQIGVCIDPGHKTAANIQLKKCFTVSIGTAETVTACDYVGIVSGNDEPDKFRKAGFHAVKSAFVDAPLIAELPMTLECRLISFDASCGCAVGEIVNVSADESILDENGKVDANKLKPIIYDGVSHAYWGFGEKVGQAFSDGKKIK